MPCKHTRDSSSWYVINDRYLEGRTAFVLCREAALRTGGLYSKLRAFLTEASDDYLFMTETKILWLWSPDPGCEP